MSDLFSEENKQQEEELFKHILLRCPECGTQKVIRVPVKIIAQNGMLTSVGIPIGLICNHSFQALIDQNFSVRAYNLADFIIPRTEYTQVENFDNKREVSQSEVQNEVQNQINLIEFEFFDDIINLLRTSVDDREILGSAMFTTEGNVLYSSLTNNALVDTVSEFELRSKEKLHEIHKMFLELKNHQKVCSEYLKIQDVEVILVLIFSEMINFAIGNMYLMKLVKKVEEFGKKL
jgi:hypothetical protein